MECANNDTEQNQQENENQIQEDSLQKLEHEKQQEQQQQENLDQLESFALLTTSNSNQQINSENQKFESQNDGQLIHDEDNNINASKSFHEQGTIEMECGSSNERPTLTQQQQNLMQLYLASSNLEQLDEMNNSNNQSKSKSLEDDDNNDENEEDDEEEDDDEDDEEEKINESNGDKIFKTKSLKRPCEDTNESLIKNEFTGSLNSLSTPLSQTVQSLIAAASISTSPPSTTNISNTNSSSKKSRIAAIPGKPRGATYDGNSCMICSDRASGFHYGVLACEGCKGFFKRICKEPNEMQSKRHCVYGGNCDINLRTRNRCQYCRIQKCIQLGMSKDGIKLGRRSRKFKENLVQIVSSSSSTLNSSNSATTTTASSHSHTTATSSMPSTTTTYHEQNHQPTTSASSLGGVKLISQMSDLNSKLQNDQQQNIRQQHHSNSSISNHVHQQQQHHSLLISNNTNMNNQIFAINADNQIQQIIIPSDQSNALQNPNKQVIAIIQDNKLILKTIDLSAVIQPLTSTTTSVTGITSTPVVATPTTTQTSIGPKIIQIQSSNNPINVNLNPNSLNTTTQHTQNPIIINSNNLIQITPASNNVSPTTSTTNLNTSTSNHNSSNSNSNNANVIQLLPKTDLNQQQTTFSLDNNQFDNLNTQQLQNQNSNFNQMHKLAAVAAAAAAASSSIPSTTSTTITTASSNTTVSSSSSNSSNQNTNASYTVLELSQINQINELIFQAHKDTWPYLKDKCKKFKMQYNLKRNTNLEQLFSKGLLQLLKETKFLDYFNSLIENTVLFAKIVPYFMDMHETDRITLLKTSVFEIICIRHSQLFDLIANKFILPLYETHLNKEFLIQKLPECKTFIELLFDFINEFSSIDLSDLEISVFCSFLLFNTDNESQLNDSEKLVNYRNLYRGLLIHELNKNHTKFNNNLPVQNWLNSCCIKLKKLNHEHSQILSRLKKSIQFPDLYAELYNL